MERLTYRTTAGAGIWDGSSSVLPSDIYKQNPIHHLAIIRALNKLAAYEDAEEAGLLVRLPVPIGTKIWRISDKVRHDVGHGILEYYPDVQKSAFGLQDIYSLNKTAFLIYEAAEAALKTKEADHESART